MKLARTTAGTVAGATFWGAYWVAYMAAADLTPSWHAAAALALIASVAAAAWAVLDFIRWQREKSQPDGA